VAGAHGIGVSCGTCGPIVLDPTLVEVHRDRDHGFALVTFLCVRCGELGATRCPDVLARSRSAAVAEHRLTCTSPPSVTGP
jgi:hypothetical protein